MMATSVLSNPKRSAFRTMEEEWERWFAYEMNFPMSWR
jgi:hypothetical protein